MLRVSISRFGVSPFARFLLDTKNKFRGLTFDARSKAAAKAYNAVMKKPATRNALLKRASKTTTFTKRSARPRKPNSMAAFRAAVSAAKLVAPVKGNSAKSFAQFSKQTAALWKKYKAAAVERNKGKALPRNLTKFDMKLARAVAQQK
jgi:hypothetical protein